MAMRVGINGFGRIGRLVLRAGINNPELEFVAVNDLTNAETLAHLFKYDSTFGIYPGNVQAKASSILIGNRILEVVAERDPTKLPWKSLDVDLVIEATGRFTDAGKAKAHLSAGAQRVIISAPAKDEDITICMGINEDRYQPDKHFIISNASCTTNCLAPMAKVLHENYRIVHGLMTTVHSYTNDQVILDFPHKDLRRARAAGVSMIPTTTGAARAIGLVLPELKGKLGGLAIRVPTPDVSMVDLTVEVDKATSETDVNEKFLEASRDPRMSRYLQYSQEPLISKDFVGNPASCIFDAPLTAVIGKTLIKTFGWYDNEWGYASRIVDLAAHVAKKIVARVGP